MTMPSALETPFDYIPFHRPDIGEAEVREVIEVLRSGWLTTGPKTALFEKNFANYTHAQHAIAVNSCTAGLHLVMVAFDIGVGDEVITSPYTFAATGETIIHAGARPVFADIEQDGFNVSVERIAAAITPRTRAIIPVHFAGEPCRMDEIRFLAQKHHLVVIEDAAHACGTIYKNTYVGNIGDATCFSFYATKNLTTGEGGMITTNNEKMAQRIRRLSLHGLSKDAWNRYTAHGNWYYEICECGFKYNLSDIQSAIGLRQLERYEEMQQQRFRLVKVYQEQLADVDEIILPPTPSFCRHAWHLFAIRLNLKLLSIDRDEFIRCLLRAGIGSSVHFIPLHLHPFYHDHFDYQVGDFPNAEKTYRSVISLPLYPLLSLNSVSYICATIRSLVQRYFKKQHHYLREVAF